MKKGFVTLAVGDERYYQLAVNLLLSYKHHSKEVYPFAIVADCENEYTAMFDKVVLLSNPSRSYMDKIEMLVHPPFDYNVFIDADCLIYRDIASLLDVCAQGVAMYGTTYALTEKGKSWYEKENLCEYKDVVDYGVGVHGGIIFYCDDDVTRSIYKDCKNIVSHYSDFHFAMFDKPADEPIVALAMAVNGCKPISRASHYDIYGFFPTFKDYRMNIKKGILAYSFDGDNWIENVKICHWQNCNTESPVYKREVDRLKHVDEVVSLLKFFYRQGLFWGKNNFRKLIHGFRWHKRKSFSTLRVGILL